MMSTQPRGAAPPRPQMLFFRAARGNALTILRAGLALTMTVLPKISRLPALVAGLVRVLIFRRPGSMKTPVLVTSFVAISVRLLMAFMTTVFFSSCSAASASAMEPLVMAFAGIFAARGAVEEEVDSTAKKEL